MCHDIEKLTANDVCGLLTNEKSGGEVIQNSLISQILMVLYLILNYIRRVKKNRKKKTGEGEKGGRTANKERGIEKRKGNGAVKEEKKYREIIQLIERIHKMSWNCGKKTCNKGR